MSKISTKQDSKCRNYRKSKTPGKTVVQYSRENRARKNALKITLSQLGGHIHDINKKPKTPTERSRELRARITL